MSALVDKIAAIIEPLEFPGSPGHQQGECEFCDENRDHVRAKAVAILKAIRDPSDAMLASQGRSRPDLAKSDFQREGATRLNEQVRAMAKTIWQELIDAAIQEHSTTPPRNAS